MVWEIPYIFIAGTKAKANEVNSNFTSIKQFVDQLESNQATNELNISSLESNKANVNGSQTEIFQVANAANNFDAVNLQSLKDYTANSLDVIRGFIPSKSNSTTISCTAGDCWDTTYEQMISSTTALSLQDTSLANNATYYIYVCYDKETSTCKLVFSTNSTTPTLPAGYDYFRKIGSFTTDGSGDIDNVSPIGSVDLSSRVGFIGENFGSQIKASTSYTADRNHWLYAAAMCYGQSNPEIIISVNGVHVARVRASWKYASESSALVPIKKGQKVTITIDRADNYSYCQKINMT